MRYPTKAECRQATKKVVKVEGYIQTYRLFLHLECGHTTTRTMSGAKYNKGERGPKALQCYDCAKALAAATEAKGGAA